MADAPAPGGAPKKDEKPAGGGGTSNSQAFAEIAMLLLVLIMISNIVTRLSSHGFSLGNSSIVLGFKHFYARFKIFSVIISVPLIFVVANLVQKMNAIRAEEKKLLYPEKPVDTPAAVVNAKWQRVIDHLESSNSSDWKLAIIEADIILGEMLDKMGYHGESIGEKLKQIERSDFTTIDKAWEAHKVRNLIAHEGATFELTRKEAFRIVELYKQVFEEFFFI